MQERHEREQYFFDDATLAALADALTAFDRPCVLCAPMLGRELARRGRRIRVLDLDERFADVPGFLGWDLYRPAWLAERFDVILCDPPFFSVRLDQLFDAIRQLAHYDTGQRVAVSYLTRRAAAILGAFAPFGLQPTGFYPGYRTVQKCAKNEIEFYANFPFSGADTPVISSAQAGGPSSGGGPPDSSLEP